MKDDSYAMLHAMHDYGLITVDGGSHIWLTGEREYAGNLEAGDTDEPGVEHIMASRFIKNLKFAELKGASLVVHMKTCGGDWQEGMAIYDSVRNSFFRLGTKCVVYTHARSMTSIILQAFDTRVLMPNSYMMIHDGETSVAGTIKQVESAMKFDSKQEDVMLDIYAERMQCGPYFMGVEPSKIKKWLKRQMDKKEDVYFTAEEAVEYGLADCVAGD